MTDQDRNIAAECISDLEKVKNLLDDAPHKIARECIRLIDNVIGAWGEKFPGHEYAGRCGFCDEPKGIDEMVGGGDDGEPACSDCVKRWTESEKAQ